MISLILMLITVVLAITVVVFGLYNYQSQFVNPLDKENFNFLNEFPYEMQDNEKMKHNSIFRILVSLYSSSFLVFGLNEFFFLSIEGSKSVHDYIIGSIFVVTAIATLCLFMLDLTKYKQHLFITSVIFTLTVILYVYCGLFVYIDFRHTYNEILAIVLFVIAGILLLTLIISPLKKWMYLEKKEENGIITYHRKKLSILPFMEWVFLGADLLLVILLALF